jgi:hypothetical protein
MASYLWERTSSPLQENDGSLAGNNSGGLGYHEAVYLFLSQPLQIELKNEANRDLLLDKKYTTGFCLYHKINGFLWEDQLHNRGLFTL